MQIIEELTGKVTKEDSNLSCTFRVVFFKTKLDLEKSKVKCSTKPSKTIKIKDYEIRSLSGSTFTLSMTMWKTGKTKITKGSIEHLATMTKTSGPFGDI